MFGLKHGKLAMVQCVGSADIVSKHSTIHTTDLGAINILCGQPSCYEAAVNLCEHPLCFEAVVMFCGPHSSFEAALKFSGRGQAFRPQAGFEAAVRL
jgi:hypothetical protein